MKKLFGLSLAVVMGVSIAEANLLNNQSFESGTDDWSSWNSENIITPNNWGWAQEGAAMAGMWSTAGLWQDFDVTAGGTYQASVYAYEADGADAMSVGTKYAVAKMEWYTSGGVEIGSDAWNLSIGGTGTGYNLWTQYSSAEVVAPETAAYGRLNLEIQGTGDGRIYFDNASVAAVPEPSILALVSLGLGTLFLTLRRKVK